MKILLLGKNGQVGWELQRALAPLEFEVICLRSSRTDGFVWWFEQTQAVYWFYFECKAWCGRKCFCLYSSDLAESEQRLADQINHLSIQKIAQTCQLIDALFVHYSTDYVFNGVGDQPFSETDDIAPLNVYGKTTLGEQAIINSDCAYLIFRTSLGLCCKR